MSTGDDLVEQLALSVNGEHMLAQHVDDGNGRCGFCSVGRDGGGRVPWPCDGHRMAQRVIELQQARRLR